MDQRFFNYYTELLNQTIQDLFSKSIILQTNQKIATEELLNLRKENDRLKEEISQLKSNSEEKSSEGFESTHLEK